VRPIFQINYRHRSIGLAAPTPDDVGDGRVADCKSPFRAISQDYFANEAPQHFAHEAVLFFMMMVTVALPLLNAALAVLELIRI
jgi:hypothetical protein